MERELKNPITGISDCCARTASGQANGAPPSADMNCRRPMLIVIDPARWGTRPWATCTGTTL